MIGLFGPDSISQGTKTMRVFASNNKSGEPYALITLVGHCPINVEYDTNGDGIIDDSDFDNCITCVGHDSGGSCGACDLDGSCKIDW